MSGEYEQLRTYCDDLTARLKLEADWKERHPDFMTQEFRQDDHEYYLAPIDQKPTQFVSSFDPADPRPNTSDIVTASFFNALMVVALAAYEKAVRGE